MPRNVIRTVSQWSNSNHWSAQVAGYLLFLSLMPLLYVAGAVFYFLCMVIGTIGNFLLVGYCLVFLLMALAGCALKLWDYMKNKLF